MRLGKVLPNIFQHLQGKGFTSNGRYILNSALLGLTCFVSSQALSAQDEDKATDNKTKVTAVSSSQDKNSSKPLKELASDKDSSLSKCYEELTKINSTDIAKKLLTNIDYAATSNYLETLKLIFKKAEAHKAINKGNPNEVEFANNIQKEIKERLLDFLFLDVSVNDSWTNAYQRKNAISAFYTLFSNGGKRFPLTNEQLYQALLLDNKRINTCLAIPTECRPHVTSILFRDIVQALRSEEKLDKETKLELRGTNEKKLVSKIELIKKFLKEIESSSFLLEDILEKSKGAYREFINEVTRQLAKPNSDKKEIVGLFNSIVTENFIKATPKDLFKTGWNTNLEPIFEQVEKLEPKNVFRGALLSFLGKIAILQSSLPNKATIGQRLIKIMEKNQEKANWSEIVPVILNIIKEQAILNKKILESKNHSLINPEISGIEILHIESDKELLEPLSKLFSFVFSKSLTDKTTTPAFKELQFEAAKLAIALTNNPFCYGAPIETWQKARFKELVDLPEERAHEIANHLAEIGLLYKEAKIEHPEIQRKLVTSIKGELITLFQGCLKLLSSSNPQKQKIGGDNLSALYEVSKQEGAYYPYYLRYALGEEAKKDPSNFFSVTLQRPIPNPKACEAVVKAGLTILYLSQDREALPLSFAQGLSLQINDALNTKQNNERERILESGVSQFLKGYYDYAPGIANINSAKILQTLIPPYTKLVQRHNLESQYLNSALNIFVYFKNISCNDNGVDKATQEATHNNLMDLLSIILEGIGKVSDQKERQELKRNACTLPRYFHQTSMDRQKVFIELFSKKLFNRGNKDIDEILNLKDSIVFNNQFTQHRHLAWPSSILLKFISENKDYFSSCVDESIKKIQASTESRERLEAMDKIVKVISIFREVINFGNSYGVAGGNSQHELQEIGVWLNEKVEKPILECFLARLDKEKVTVTKTTGSSNERLIECPEWKELNRLLSEIITKNRIVTRRQAYSESLIGCIRKRLKKEKDPYAREISFQTLSITGETSIPLLRSGIVSEEFPQAIRGISNVIANGLMNDYELRKALYSNNSDKYFTFFNEFIDSIYANKEFNKKNLSEPQIFVTEIIRLIDGDESLYVKLLPHCKFKVNADGKLDPRELDELFKLRRNAYLTLGYTASYCPNNSFKIAVAEFLEKRLERYDTPEKLGVTWGDEIAALIEIYHSMEGTVVSNKVFVEEKIKFLKKILFDGYVEWHTVNGEEKMYKISSYFEARIEGSLFKQFVISKGIDFYKLKEEEKRELKESKEYEKIKTKVRTTKEELAHRVLNLAPNRSMQFYVNCLIGMGYGRFQVDELASNLLK